MCGNQYQNNYYNTASAKPSPQEAAQSLARLMEKQLGYNDGHIDSIALRLFVRAYWSRVSTWAHIIHDET